MAQFYTDFSEYPLDVAPEDWTTGPEQFSVFKIITSATTGNKVLRAETDTFGLKYASWNPTQNIESPDVEIVCAFRHFSGSYMELAGRLNENTNGIDAYSWGYFADRRRIHRYLDGSRDLIATTGPDSAYKTGKQFLKLQIFGNNVKAKEWSEIDGEQEGWFYEITNSEVTAAGLAALFLSNNGISVEVESFAVGTDGDPAPTEPVGGGTTDDLTANDISSTSEVSSPAISQTHALTANDVSSLSSVTSPTLGQTHSLTATGVQSTSEVSSPALATQSNTDNLSANDISSTSSVSAPALGQIHSLAANDATSTSETGTPALQQTHALTSVDIQSLSTASSPALTSVAGQDSLAANDVQATSEVSSPTIGQVHNLTPDNLSSQSETDSPTLGQVHALTATGAESASQVSSPTLRDASQVLVTPIRNTKATVSQTTYKAAIIQPVYKAEAG